MNETTKPYNEIDDYIAAFSDEERQEYVAADMALDLASTLYQIRQAQGLTQREAAEVVAGASLQALAGLIDQSLLRLNATGRYDVHELLRQYGAEQLDAADQTEPDLIVSEQEGATDADLRG